MAHIHEAFAEYETLVEGEPRSLTDLPRLALAWSALR